jgi:DNA processing protein
VVENLSLFDARPSLSPTPPAVAPPSAPHWLLALMSGEGVDVDTLVAASGRPLSEVLSALSMLEAQGSVLREAGRYLRCQSGLATPGESR